MILYNDQDEVVKIYPYDSEEQQRFEKVLEILFEADKSYLEKLLKKKREEREQISQILDDSDKKVLCKVEKERIKRYNLTQTAKILGTTRQNLYHWINKGWIKPRRDYKNYLVFTVFNIKESIKWWNPIK